MLISSLSWNRFQSDGTIYLALGIEYGLDLVTNRTGIIVGGAAETAEVDAVAVSVGVVIV